MSNGQSSGITCIFPKKIRVSHLGSCGCKKSCHAGRLGRHPRGEHSRGMGLQVGQYQVRGKDCLPTGVSTVPPVFFMRRNRAVPSPHDDKHPFSIMKGEYTSEPASMSLPPHPLAPLCTFKCINHWSSPALTAASKKRPHPTNMQGEISVHANHTQTWQITLSLPSLSTKACQHLCYFRQVTKNTRDPPLLH